MSHTPSTSLSKPYPRNNARLQRNVGYCLLAGLFFLGFFHRFSPSALADAIVHDLGVSAASLGVIVSMNFWVYTLMQLPAGILIDRYGVRRIAAGGAVLTACGAFVFSWAHDTGMAMLGPALVGMGTSSVFSGIMKYNMLWFPARRYAVVTGVTMLLGTLGSLMAEGPAAALLAWVDWRTLLQAVALATVLLSAAVLLLVRDAPCVSYTARTEPGVRPATCGTPGWRILALRIAAAISNRQLWKLLVCTAGTNGTFYAFAGLWAVPYLVNHEGMDSMAAVAVTSASMAAYGFGALLIGQLSDRIHARRPLIVACSIVGACAWLMLAWHPPMPNSAVIALCILLGLSASQVTVSFTAIKESTDIDAGATAIAFGNTGVFLVAAVVQMLYGAILNMGSAQAGIVEGKALAGGAYGLAMWLPATLACVGVVAALGVREMRPDRKG
jgi:MFS family permease